MHGHSLVYTGLALKASTYERGYSMASKENIKGFRNHTSAQHVVAENSMQAAAKLSNTTLIS